MTIVKSTALLSLLAAARIVAAEPKAAEPPKQPTKSAGAPAQGDRKALMRELRAEREKTVSERGAIFAKITVKRDYTGEWVVFRDKDVTAFLDLKDPQHPRFKPERDDEGPAENNKNRAHILVVPNEPRETIGKTIASDISTEDLELTLKVMRAATTLAGKLSIKNPRVYVRSPARVGVGYLHVHIVGERDPKVPYPAPLKP